MFAEETTGSDKSEITQFHENLKLRETARVAFIRSDHDMKLRRSFLRRARPPRCSAQAGKWVMYWRNGKGAAPGAWHGPAKVIMRESENLVWISHMSRLYRCAPEHLRELSSREQEDIPRDHESEAFPSPNVPRIGTGVFQYHDLTQQNPPPESPVEQPHQEMHPPASNPHSSNHNDTDNPEINNPNQIMDTQAVPDATASEQPESVQPDAEPEAVSSQGSQQLAAGSESPQPWEVPVPPAADGELSDAYVVHEDTWLIHKDQLIRVHRRPRLKLFSPSDMEQCPISCEWLLPERQNIIETLQGNSWKFNDIWRGNIEAHQQMPVRWIGRTSLRSNQNISIPHTTCNLPTFAITHNYMAKKLHLHSPWTSLKYACEKIYLTK
jgi:hypothetical protein